MPVSVLEAANHVRRMYGLTNSNLGRRMQISGGFEFSRWALSTRARQAAFANRISLCKDVYFVKKKLFKKAYSLSRCKSGNYEFICTSVAVWLIYVERNMSSVVDEQVGYLNMKFSYLA